MQNPDKSSIVFLRKIKIEQKNIVENLFFKDPSNSRYYERLKKEKKTICRLITACFTNLKVFRRTVRIWLTEKDPETQD